MLLARAWWSCGRRVWLRGRRRRRGHCARWRPRSLQQQRAVRKEISQRKGKKACKKACKQGTDLIELRLTWREMENLNFERYIRIFGDIIEDFWRFFEEFEEFWRNRFVVRRLRTSINWRQTEKMSFWGHYSLQTASEVRSDLRYKIYDPNFICYHVVCSVLAFFWTNH